MQADKQQSVAKVTKAIFLNASVFFILIGLLSLFTLMFTRGDYISIVVVAILLAAFAIATLTLAIAVLRKEVGKKKYLLITGVLISSIVGTAFYQVTI